jgi:hypothetical protein
MAGRHANNFYLPFSLRAAMLGVEEDKDRKPDPHGNAMKKIILLLSITLFSWLGWWLGAYIGIMTAWLLGFAGSLLGVVIGVRFNQAYLD